VRLRKLALVGCLPFLLGWGSPVAAQESEITLEAAREVLDRSLGFLVSRQNEDGSWGPGFPQDLNDIGFAWESYYAWDQAASAVVLTALLRAPETPERRAALERGFEWLCSTRLAHRGSNWDVDSTWASLYGFTAVVRAASDARFAGDTWSEKLERRGLEYYADLAARQTLEGGWAYYDDPPYTAKPTWATSFCTALVLPSLVEAKDDLGWAIDSKLLSRAVDVVERCALPNGAYSYNVNTLRRGHGGESIDQVPGSLGRIQVCNWALQRCGVKRITPDLLREGLEAFFRYHSYLDHARLRPIPHEGFFANAGYFYFFAHYYAAEVIGLLPEEEREEWFHRLWPHLIKTIGSKGSTSDYGSSSYMVNAGTGFAVLALSGVRTKSAATSKR
jgi:hypothetical protein